LRGQLNEKLNNHPYTKELDEIIANKEFKVGVEAPEFSIKGMDGEDIELKNFAGKYIPGCPPLQNFRVRSACSGCWKPAACCRSSILSATGGAAGKYILLDFWASWCGPCRNEMPNVVKLYKECKGKNFEIIGISVQ